MQSFFTDLQWDWVADRLQDGYTINEVADFLGVHRNSIRRGLIRRGIKPLDREDLPPLKLRRAEFLGLTRVRVSSEGCGERHIERRSEQYRERHGE